MLLMASGSGNAFICLLAGADKQRMQRPAPYVPWQPQRPGYQPLPPIVQPMTAQPPRQSSGPRQRPPSPPGLWRPVN